MTVICEECGKVYHIDPDKLDQYKGKSVRVRCGECGHVTQISKLIEATEEPTDDFAAADVPSMPSMEPDLEEREEEPVGRPDSISVGTTDIRTSGWLGLRGKMMILFLVLPILLMAVSGYISQQQLNKLANEITDDSTALVLEEGKEKLMQKARDVALQAEIYLRNHPDLVREDFFYDPEFSGIAVQSVGQSGYTCIIQQPEPDKGQNWTLWAHPNPNIVGIDDIDMLRKALGPYFSPFMEVLSASQGMKEAEGFYRWKDPDGKIREKYMAVSPIQLEGMPFLLMSTAYIDEFTGKTEILKNRAKKLAEDTMNINFGILIGAIVLIGLIITIYGYRLTRNIQYLTEAADRISVGDLEAEIDVYSKDEIGNLADAISRMQDSLRFSIERLRRRR
ncbi:MAG: HAMP domain-containing protein [Desulfobacteraceae bacterium]|nr:zinc-ribbon domain-containing protein [Desulfobacteraceae bacterium]MBC2756676.1 HAMP domain-containing protein [Desulfobacteraceae bacterium]